jgi:hypothetical protein
MDMCMCINYEETYEIQITEYSKTAFLRKLKRCKAPRCDQIPAELIQAVGDTVLWDTYT